MKNVIGVVANVAGVHGSAVSVLDIGNALDKGVVQGAPGLARVLQAWECEAAAATANWAPWADGRWTPSPSDTVGSRLQAANYSLCQANRPKRGFPPRNLVSELLDALENG